jgi:hypothetical protein
LRSQFSTPLTIFGGTLRKTIKSSFIQSIDKQASRGLAPMRMSSDGRSDGGHSRLSGEGYRAT